MRRQVAFVVRRSCAYQRCLSTAKPFDKVLIANRGEIVERVMRTCHEMDIDTVAVYSTADAKSRFVREASESICIGSAAASDSYLNTDRILEAINLSGAQALHPGYGFLSENAAFSALVSKRAVFLGPSADSIRQLGDKLESKQLAIRAGVNVVPGFDGVVESLQHALQLCQGELGGYPVLLKAAAGGGGKGMRICRSDQDIRDAWNVAKAEAQKFFMDDRLLLEKYIEKPHHIEFQVMSSKNKEGSVDVVVFPERECSIQRRNQKIIEESPSLLLMEDTRMAMAEQVRKLCQLVGYESAGTVEFLVDEHQNFYFLEMNTRLQVEHPVTEAVCGGVDLVKAMLWIGAGWGLTDEIRPYTQGVMPVFGHAIEARIYAEDPVRGFLPSTGPLTLYHEPSTEKNTEDSYVRIDSGVEMGHVVTPHYDPMLSKLIYKGRSRSDSIAGLMSALDEYVIEGVQHNATLVQSVLRNDTFAAGETPTSFLDTHYPDGFQRVDLTLQEEHNFALAAALIDHNRRRHLQEPPLVDGDDPQRVVVRMGGMFGELSHRVRIDNDHSVGRVENIEDEDANDIQIEYQVLDPTDSSRFLASIAFDGIVKTVQVLGVDDCGLYTLQMYGARRNVLIQSELEFELSSHMNAPVIADTSHQVLSPMPGTLISFAVREGDTVEPGQELCIVEAMKMQNIIRSSRRGVVGSLLAESGSLLKADEALLEFEERRSKVD